MNNLETACLLSCERWADTFEKEIPEHTFSDEHNEKMKPLLSDNLIKYKPKLSKKTLKFILIAAIILSLAITVFATAKPAFEKYSLKKYSDHSEYEILSKKKETQEVKSLTVNYIPEGFEKTEIDESNYMFLYRYENSNEFFYIKKLQLGGTTSINTEKYDSEKIKIGNLDAVYYQPETNFGGLLFNNGEYVYIVSGNISKDELVKIAQGTR